MKRLLDATAVLLLVLCTAVVALWVRSLTTTDHITWPGESQDGVEFKTHLIMFLSSRGALHFSYGGAVVRSDDAEALKQLNVAEYYKWHPHGLEFKSLPATDYPFAWANVPDSMARALGFEFGNDQRAADKRGIASFSRWILLPDWAVVCALGVMPALRLVLNLRRRRRTKIGLCSVCGYDLRASPKYCPECGTAHA